MNAQRQHYITSKNANYVTTEKIQACLSIWAIRLNAAELPTNGEARIYCRKRAHKLCGWNGLLDGKFAEPHKNWEIRMHTVYARNIRVWMMQFLKYATSVVTEQIRACLSRCTQSNWTASQWRSSNASWWSSIEGVQLKRRTLAVARWNKMRNKKLAMRNKSEWFI